ncbi:MAG: response regulator [Gemmatimonadales bacterium]|nr:response regulator [Gemmatimonadales bacterium]
MKLQTGIILLITGISLATALSSSFLVDRIVSGALENELGDQARVATGTLAEHIVQNVIDGEVVEVHEALVNLLDRSPSIQYIYVVDFDGSLFVHTFEGEFPGSLAESGHQHIGPYGLGLIEELRLSERDVLDVCLPLISGMTAHVHLGVDMEHMYSRIAILRNWIVGIAAFLALCGILLAAFFIRRLTLPLLALAEAMREFGSSPGGDEFRFERGLAEVTDLGNSFNRMIVDRRRAEDDLKVAKEFSENLLEAANTIIVTLDSEATITTFNTYAAVLSGYGKEEVLGRSWFDIFIPQEDKGKIPQVFLKALEEMPEVSEYENPILLKNGEERLINWSNSVLRKADGSIYGLLSVGLDVTDRKRDEVEKLGLERQVQHAQKLESLGVLAGGIAHDFNNLLMVILGNADLALDELSPLSPARGNLQEIEKATKRAADLAKQMLAYSGKGKFVVESIDAGELVEQIAHLLEVSISKKALLKYNFAENLPTFEGDATQIRQIIMNLITNASEAIGEMSGVIALSTGAMVCDSAYLQGVNDVLRASLDDGLPKGVYVYFEVADTGCGMDAETVGKIFDPFFTTKFIGRGLGMSAVLGIVRGHGGAIKIYSEVGKGTTFKVLFPASESSDLGSSVTNEVETADQAWRGSGTILLADDEETVCAVGKIMLERMGFAVITVADGREALEVFHARRDEITCVLLDLTMPRLDGVETFRELRRFDPEVRVILCSGYNEQDSTQHFVGKGLAGFIQKPYNIAALRSKLKEALSDSE